MDSRSVFLGVRRSLAVAFCFSLGTSCMLDQSGPDSLGSSSAMLAASEISATITSATCGNSDGAISLVVSGENPPFSYLWSNDATTADITDIPAGTYTVTVTDSLDESVEATYRVGNLIDWTNLVGVTGTSTLTKTAINGWNSGAASSNILDANVDGDIGWEITAETNGRFAVGFSTADTDVSYTSINYAFYKYFGSMLMLENGTYVGPAGTAAVGDFFLLERVGTAMNYYRNGVLVRTTTVAADVPLLADVSVYDNGSVVTDLTASFCEAPLTIGADITNTTCGGNGGAIDVAVLEGVPPYTYQWDHGPTTASLTDLEAGSYTVTVTDALGRHVTETYDVDSYGPVWAQLNGASWDPVSYTLTKTAAYGWGNSGGFSSGFIGPDEDGSVQYDILDLPTTRYIVGLSATDEDDNYSTVDYGIYYYGPNYIFVLEDGADTGVRVTPTIGDTFRIAREGSSIVYYQNSTPLRTVAVDPGVSLYADFAIFNQDAQIYGVKATFCGSSMTGDATVTQPVCGGALGSIDLVINGGVAPYAYDWSNGGTTASITDLVGGDYTVTVTDAIGQEFTDTYSLAYDAAFTNLVGVTFDDIARTLTKTAINGWNAGGESWDVLPGDTDGFFEFSTPTVDPHRYMIGLSDENLDNSYQTIDYAFYLHPIYGIMIIENGASRGLFGAWSAGDTFRVGREGSMISYYHNGTLLRSVAVDPALSLVVDFSMYDSGGVIHDVVTSFCSAP